MSGLLSNLFRMRFGSRMKQFDGIPGPTPTYPFGTVLQFVGKNPWEVFGDYAKQYGGTTLVWFGGHPTLVLNDPQSIRDVLDTKFDDYYKDFPVKSLKPVVGNTLFVLNPPEWTGLRKAHPCSVEGFQQWLPTQLPVVKKVADKHIAPVLGTKNEFKLLDKIQRMCFEVFNACIVGPDFQSGGFDNFYALLKKASFRMMLPQWSLIPPISPFFLKAKRAHFGAYERAVKMAKQNLDGDANDLLHVVLRHGTEVSDTQMATYLSNFQAGGDISSASAIVNTIYLLNEHPEISKELYAELIELKGANDEFDWASVDKCTRLDHVLRESLRIMPPVTIFGRSVCKDRKTVLGDREIPPNTPVLVVVNALQRSDKHWENPDTFDPSRWANGGVEANPIGSDYFFPFGRGPRMCVGMEMAMFCMKIILATVLSKANVKTSGSSRSIFFSGVVHLRDLRATMVPHAVA